ncbi:MAG: hypothetical protein PVF68_07940 [Acidobacteriota bacterium]
MKSRVRVGELVSYVEPDGPEVAGLVVEIRRSDCRVLDLDRDRSYWLLMAHLRRGARTIARGSATSLLSSLVLHLDGSQLEVERDEHGMVAARIACRGIDAEGMERVRRYFGGRLEGLEVQPGGLGKIWLAVRFLPLMNHAG